MENQSNSELRELLREWEAPATPASLEARVLRHRPSWWHVLLRGYIKVPVPVACGLMILILAGAWRLATRPATGCPTATLIPAALEQPRIAPALPKSSNPAACAANSTC